MKYPYGANRSTKFGVRLPSDALINTSVGGLHKFGVRLPSDALINTSVGALHKFGVRLPSDALINISVGALHKFLEYSQNNKMATILYKETVCFFGSRICKQRN